MDKQFVERTRRYGGKGLPLASRTSFMHVQWRRPESRERVTFNDFRRFAFHRFGINAMPARRVVHGSGNRSPSRVAQAAELDLSAWRGHVPLEMLGRAKFPPIADAPFVVTLAPYGFFWFMLTGPEEGRAETPSAPLEVATVVVKEGWGEILAGRSRDIFEREVLPVVLPTRRWFADNTSRLHIDASLDLVVDCYNRTRAR